MGQGEHVPQLPDEIEQHVGMHPVNPGGVRAGGFPCRLVHVHPAARQQLFEIPAVGFPQRGQLLDNQIPRLLVGIALLRQLHHRHIAVVDVQLLHAQHPAAQLQVLVISGQSPPHRLDEAGVNRPGQRVGEQRGLQAVGIAPGPGREHVGAHLPGV